MSLSATIKVPGTTVEKLRDEKLPLQNRSIHLSLELREDQLLAALLDKHANQYLVWASFPVNKDFTIEEIMQDDILSMPASSISVTFTPNSYILVPALYFKKDAVKSYLHTQQLDKTSEAPCYDYIKSLDSYNLYTVAKSLDTLKARFPGASFRHYSSIFMEYLLIENKNNAEDKTFVSVFNNYMDIVVLKEGKLVLSNRYYFESSGDFIYNLLWVYEQLKLNAEKAPCIFYGEVERNSEIFKLATTYIKRVMLGEKNEQFSYSIPLNSLSPHKYRSLFTQYICV